MRLFKRPRNPKHLWDFPVPDGLHVYDSGASGSYTLRRGGLNLIYESRRGRKDIRVWYNLRHQDKEVIKEMLEAMGYEYPPRAEYMWMKVKQ